MDYCCKQMKRNVEYRCDEHPSPFDCPDNLIIYIEKFDEFGLIIHDGGSSFLVIQFCPWCGAELPESKRDRWFEEIESMGLEPGDDAIPPSHLDRSWYATSGSNDS